VYYLNFEYVFSNLAAQNKKLVEHTMFRLICDEDGWSIQLNQDPALPHFIHIMPMENVTELHISGSIDAR
jgi:hypothetical protein